MAGQKRKRPASGAKSNKRRKANTGRKIKRAKAAVYNSVITEQSDKRVDYVSVKKPIGKAKREIVFKNKVFKALEKTTPLVTKLFNMASAATVSGGAGNQCWQVFHLKPWRGSAAAPGAGSAYNEAAQTDLYKIADDIYSNATATELSHNYWIKQAWMDIAVENAGSNDGILEIYELVYLQKPGSPMNGFASFNAALTGALATTTTLGGTAPSLTERGYGPFDITALLREYGIKVVKKVTVEMTANDKTIYTVKDYRKHYIDYDSAGGSTLKYCVPGLTKSVLLIGKTTQNDGAVTLRASAEKHYRIQPTYEQQELTLGGLN